MQIDEQLHQRIDLLPMELKAKVLDFILHLEQDQKKQTTEQEELMAMIKEITPVKAPLSSEEMTRMLRDGKEHELSELVAHHGK